MIAPCPGRGRALAVALFLVALTGCGEGAHDRGAPSSGGAPGSPHAAGAPGESLSTVLAHADSSFRDGDYAEAQNAYEQALQIDPEQSRATANLATCYLKNRIVKRAEVLLQGFLGRHPDDAGARLVLARVLARQGELGPAADSLREVLRTHPDVVMAHYNLGLIAYRSRLYDEAEAHLKQSVRLKPDLPDAHYTLGLTYLALNRYPDYAPTYNQIGQLQIRLGRRDEAFQALQRAIELDPKLGDPHYLLSGLYRERGDQQAADRELETFAALEVIPEGKSGY